VTKAFGLDLGFHHDHGIPLFAIVAIAVGIVPSRAPVSLVRSGKRCGRGLDAYSSGRGLGGRVRTSSGMPSWDTIAASRYLIHGDAIVADTVDPGCSYACGEVSVMGSQLFT